MSEMPERSIGWNKKIPKDGAAGIACGVSFASAVSYCT